MTLDEERQILATALLEVHESKRSARRNAAHVAITADQMKEAAQRLEELAATPTRPTAVPRRQRSRGCRTPTRSGAPSPS